MEKELVDGYRVLSEGMEKCPVCGAMCCGMDHGKMDEEDGEMED